MTPRRTDEGELMPESSLGDALMRGDVLMLVDNFNVLFPPRAVVISHKESRVPPRPGASSLYIQTKPLRNVAYVPMEWRHIDEHFVETEVLEQAVCRASSGCTMRMCTALPTRKSCSVCCSRQ